MTNYEIEKEVFEQINELIKKFNNRFISKGITYDIQLKSDDFLDVQNYSSEVEINFYINKQFFDIIEFFIFRNGSLNINKESIISELAIDIEEIIDKKLKKYAIIPVEYISNGIKWLVVEKDPLDSGGYFLHKHKSLEEPCAYDDWFKELEHALQAAKEDFGINEEDWKDF